MIGKTERVILVKGNAKSWYEQAIFIIKPTVDTQPLDFVAEAEKIIHEYNLKQAARRSASLIVSDSEKLDVKSATDFKQDNNCVQAKATGSSSFTGQGEVGHYTECNTAASLSSQPISLKQKKSASRKFRPADFVLGLLMIVACMIITAVLTLGFFR